MLLPIQTEHPEPRKIQRAKDALEAGDVIRGLDESRDGLEPGAARRSAPPFTGDQLEAFIALADENRLDHTEATDRVDQ